MATKITYKEYDLDKLPLFKEYLTTDIKDRCIVVKDTLYVPTDIATKVSQGMRGPDEY